MKLSQISIDLPARLPEFSQLERDQTIFTIQLIQIRKLAGSISEDLHRLEPHKLVKKYKRKLRIFYHELPSHLRFGKEISVLPPSTSLWERRTYYCILLDYCQAWITIYRTLLPSSSATRTSSLENEAILHTSQAAVAAVKLFQAWFQSSALSSEGFDCFFRPYLYHFLSIKKILCVSQDVTTPPFFIHFLFLNLGQRRTYRKVALLGLHQQSLSCSSPSALSDNAHKTIV